MASAPLELTTASFFPLCHVYKIVERNQIALARHKAFLSLFLYYEIVSIFVVRSRLELRVCVDY